MVVDFGGWSKSMKMNGETSSNGKIQDLTTVRKFNEKSKNAVPKRKGVKEPVSQSK